MKTLFMHIINLVLKLLRFKKQPRLVWKSMGFPDKESQPPITFDNEYKVNGVFRGIDNLVNERTTYTIQHDNFRETVISSVTNSFNRQRQLVCALSIALFDNPKYSLPDIVKHINKNKLKFYTTEANSVLFNKLQETINPKLFYFSEYFDKKFKSGKKIKGVLHQDLQKTSFKDNSFDIITSAEVMEHVADAPTAEKEIVRILKRGGLYVFTLPFGYTLPKDIILATEKKGKIIYHQKPQYHGDPVRPEDGILVYRIFSYIDLKKRFEKLKCNYQCYELYSDELGIIGSNNFVHIVNKL